MTSSFRFVYSIKQLKQALGSTLLSNSVTSNREDLGKWIVDKALYSLWVCNTRLDAALH